VSCKDRGEAAAAYFLDTKPADVCQLIHCQRVLQDGAFLAVSQVNAEKPTSLADPPSMRDDGGLVGYQLPILLYQAVL